MTANQEPVRLLATFRDRNAADRAAEQARQLVGESHVRLGSSSDILDADKLGQDRQYDQAAPAFSSGVMTGPQARGAIKFGLPATIIGFVIFAGIGSLFETALFPRWAMALFIGMVGAFGFGAAAMVFGGGRQPEVEGEVRSTNDDVIIAVDDVDTDAQLERMLVEAGAVDIVKADHRPLRTPTNDVEAPPARHAGPRTDRIEPRR